MFDGLINFVHKLAGSIVSDPRFQVLLPFLQALAAIAAIVVALVGLFYFIKKKLDPQGQALAEHPTYRLLTAFNKFLALPSETLPERGHHSRLLWPHYRMTPYFDTGGQLEEFVQWCDGGPERLAIRAYVGSGGAGKTRLLIEGLNRLRDWDRVGFLRSGGIYAREDQDMRVGFLTEDGARRIAIVVDYCENRLEEVEALIEDLLLVQAKDRQLRARLILLARSRGEWFDEIGHERPGSVGEFVIYNPIEVVSATEKLALISEARRREMYQASVEKFAGPVLGVPRAVDASDIDLSDEAYSRPLIVQIKALISLLSEEGIEGEEGPGVTEQDKLLGALLLLEQQAWERFEEVPPALWRDILSVLTLTGGVDEAEGRWLVHELVGQYTLSEDQSEEVIRRVLESLRDPSGRIVGLLPDIFGEFQVARYGKRKHFELIDAALLHRDAKENAVEVLCRINSSDSRHGARPREQAITLLRSIIADTTANRSFITAYLAHVLGRRPPIIDQFLTSGMALEDLVAFIVRVGEFSDLLGMLGRARMIKTPPVSASDVNRLVQRSFELLITKRPAFPSSKKSLALVWKKVDRAMLANAFGRYAEGATYGDFLAVIERLPKDVAEDVLRLMPRSAADRLQENSIAAPQSVQWIIRGILSSRGHLTRYVHLRGLLSDGRLVDLMVRRGDLRSLSHDWRSEDAKNAGITNLIINVMDGLSSVEWEILFKDKSILDVAHFIETRLPELTEAAQLRVVEIMEPSASSYFSNSTRWYHLRRSAPVLERVVKGRKSASAVQLANAFQRAAQKFVEDLSSPVQAFQIGRLGLSDTISAFKIMWDGRWEFRQSLAETLGDWLPDASGWSRDNYYLLTDILIAMREDKASTFPAKQVSWLAERIEGTLAEIIEPRGGLVYHGLVYWNLMALWKVRPAAFGSRAQPLGELGLNAFTRTVEALEVDDPVGVLFLIGLLDLAQPSQRDALLTLLQSKKLRVGKEIEQKLTQRAFLTSYFCVRGLSVWRGQDMLKKYATVLWDQAKASTWRDGSLEWLESTLPTIKTVVPKKKRQLIRT